MARLTRKQIREGLDQTPIDALIVANPRETKLTHKQREFARMVALGESKAGAYRKTYNSKGTKKTDAQEGWKLSRHPDISQMVATFAEAKQFADSHTAEQLRAFVIQQLTKHATDEDIPPAQRIRCLELIGKHHGVDSFITRSEVIHTKSSGDIRARIMDKLKLIGASSTTEANAAQDDAQDAESLLAELATPSPSESLEDDTHPGATPQKGPDQTGEHTHIIPHNRISAETIPHKQSSDFDSMEESAISDAEWSDSPSMDTSPSPLSAQSALAEESDMLEDTGFSGQSVTCNVSGEKNNG